MRIDSSSSLLKYEEGFKECVYECTSGKKTIGYGWNIEDRPITEGQASRILEDHILEARFFLRRNIRNWETLSPVRKAVLVSMVFQLGPTGFMAFENTIGAIENSEWTKASIEMLDSKWARQTANRANRAAKMMRLDEWPAI
ncbi:glycoside hydrolase family protein [bacterium]|nr:glycoside hydrolase family protein [bacterium]